MSSKAISFLFAAILLASCGSSKKGTNTATAVTTPATLSENGVYAPREQELTAIQSRYKDATLQQLNEGHALYTGVCTNCHPAKDIYKRSVENWPGIMDNMSKKAKITDAQKDAVLKYVLAIKAAKPQ